MGRVVLAGAGLLAILTSACAANNNGQTSQDSESKFLDAVGQDMALAEGAGADLPSESEYLRVGNLFCSEWEDAIDDPSKPDGPILVVSDLRRTLSDEDAATLRIVWQHAEDHLCPELFDR